MQCIPKTTPASTADYTVQDKFLSFSPTNTTGVVCRRWDEKHDDGGTVTVVSNVSETVATTMA